MLTRCSLGVHILLADAFRPHIITSSEVAIFRDGRLNMPFSPSDFEWWQWFLFGIGAFLICLVMLAFMEKAKNGGAGCLLITVGIVTGLGGTLCWIIGIIRLIKWIWES